MKKSIHYRGRRGNRLRRIVFLAKYMPTRDDGEIAPDDDEIGSRKGLGDVTSKPDANSINNPWPRRGNRPRRTASKGTSTASRIGLALRC